MNRRNDNATVSGKPVASPEPIHYHLVVLPKARSVYISGGGVSIGGYDEERFDARESGTAL